MNDSIEKIYITPKQAKQLIGVSSYRLYTWKYKTDNPLLKGYHYVTPASNQTLYHRENLLSYVSNLY